MGVSACANAEGARASVGARSRRVTAAPFELHPAAAEGSGGSSGSEREVMVDSGANTFLAPVGW